MKAVRPTTSIIDEMEKVLYRVPIVRKSANKFEMKSLEHFEKGKGA